MSQTGRPGQGEPMGFETDYADLRFTRQQLFLSQEETIMAFEDFW